MFSNRKFTKSPVNVTAGKKLASDALKGRVFESNLGDLHNINSYKKIKLIIDDASDTRNKLALTNFYGMDTTKDHLCSLIRKWHTLIEASVDAKTSDGFVLRFFPIAFTKRGERQLKATTYAKRSHMKQIRKKMHEIIARFVTKNTLKDLVDQLINERLSVEIVKQCKKIYPIQNCIIRKVKTIKRPRFDSKFILTI
jgi:small subunit ribosomal protein S3Ae